MPSLRALSVKETFAHPCHVTMAVSEAPIASEEHHDHCDARVYDTVCLDEMEYVEDDQMYYYQCPCGDLFELSEVRCSLLPSSHPLQTHEHACLDGRRTCVQGNASRDARAVR